MNVLKIVVKSGTHHFMEQEEPILIIQVQQLLSPIAKMHVQVGAAIPL
jgi:hypothetical protein